MNRKIKFSFCKCACEQNLPHEHKHLLELLVIPDSKPIQTVRVKCDTITPVPHAIMAQLNKVTHTIKGLSEFVLTILGLGNLIVFHFIFITIDLLDGIRVLHLHKLYC